MSKILLSIYTISFSAKTADLLCLSDDLAIELLLIILLFEELSILLDELFLPDVLPLF